MGWLRWSRKSDDEFRVGTGAVGLDLNSSRLSAMSCETGRPPRTVLLEDPHAELPLAVSLEKATPEVGRPAWGVARRMPHLACFDFLNELGQPREWKAGRHRFDAAGLLALAFEEFHLACVRPDHLTLVLPTYLSTAKITQIAALLDKAKLPVRGSIASPLALLAGADPAAPRPHVVLVVDVDDHALSGAIVSADAHQARLLGMAALPRLNVRVWKEKLLNALADRCVRTCRRDPRDSADAEQALYEQIDDALDRARQGQKVTLSVRSEHWYQDLIQQPDDFNGYCTALVKQAVTALGELVQSAAPEPPAAIWLTHAAGRLPGLTARLHQNAVEGCEVNVLPIDAGARAAVALADRWTRDELPRTHIDAVIALPEPTADPRPASHRDGNGSVVAFRTLRFDN